MAKPTTRALVEATGISRTYAHDILKGNQPPSRPLAIYIYRQTGWKPEPIRALSEQTIAELEAVEPWAKAA